jgi:16S rRNA processing protein RimM
LSETERWLRAGTIGRPHGLDGSFHVAGGVPDLLSTGATVRVGGVDRAIVRRSGMDARPILRLEGCEDRDSARALQGTELLIARDRARELEPDEWWAEDLEGCTVLDGELEVGVVKRLLALPSCEVLEVDRSAGGSALLVPLISDAVRAVDIEHRTIDVDLRFLGEE